VSVFKEFKSSPVTVMSGISGVIVAFLSLLIAWFQFQGISTNPNVSQTTIRIPDGEIFVANALLVIAFFFIYYN